MCVNSTAVFECRENKKAYFAGTSEGVTVDHLDVSLDCGAGRALGCPGPSFSRRLRLISANLFIKEKLNLGDCFPLSDTLAGAI